MRPRNGPSGRGDRERDPLGQNPSRSKNSHPGKADAVGVLPPDPRAVVVARGVEVRVGRAADEDLLMGRILVSRPVLETNSEKKTHGWGLPVAVAAHVIRWHRTPYRA